jgi:hypothetical protein
LSRVKYLAAGSSGGIAGYVLGKLTGGDLKALLSSALDGVFKFLHEQGAYASFAIVMAAGFGGFAMWSIRKLIGGKDAEIARIAGDRDKFQKLFIEHWQSSASEKGGKKK